MDIEDHSTCGYDWLKIIAINTNELVKLCGTITKYVPTEETLCIHTNSSSLRIEFYSDQIVTRRGFALDFFLESNSNESNCLTYFTIADLNTILSTTFTPPTTSFYPIGMHYLVWYILSLNVNDMLYFETK